MKPKSVHKSWRPAWKGTGELARITTLYSTIGKPRGYVATYAKAGSLEVTIAEFRGSDGGRRAAETWLASMAIGAVG